MSHAVVSREEWLDARRALLVKEKAHTRARDALNAERMALPWVKLDKTYVFDTEGGRKTLDDLFDGRSQLLVYHFMLGPDWDAGCEGCSFMADHFDGTLPHLNHHDVTLVAVSRASLGKIQAYKRRMGWKFPWASSHGGDFNRDFHVSFTPEELAGETINYNFTDLPSGQGHDELPGLSVFHRDAEGQVFHTYSTYARGLEEALATLMLLDRAPLGRNEDETMNFIRRHDEYEEAPPKSACCAGAA
ncbi:DUF899 domain-containing protein [Caulobacter segnis]|uniref:DUF899 domain-containing protein n=2 Tax=Caulobacter segnis TaxID=88688 RepID=D5VP24_CAUST|nr:thioredoxin family protein [Caulobacter segnis]ADG12247.1 protein of unknown function DUF899 thioredoxin family protein [Caulobacter segnis ATCC 21756]AVQ03845.1 DUF899 domain-containing protein [Caulobacter segnis]